MINPILIISSFTIVVGIILLIFGAANIVLSTDVIVDSHKQHAFLIAGIVLTAVGVIFFILQFIRLILRDRKLLRKALAKEAARLDAEQATNNRQKDTTVGFY